jgi:uncharacterized DUF497 family protein
MAEWLQQLAGEAKDFDWDAGNPAKHRKHAVEPSDVEAMLRRRTVFIGRIVEPAHDEERWLLLGHESRRRPLALIFTRRGEKLRPVSCRPMRAKERKVYEEACQEGQ